MSKPEVTQHFVTFLSPGTFFHEETTEPIDSWNVEAATKMADSVIERYDATPFAFQFSTRARGPKDLDSKEVKRSGRYYLGGKIETLAEVKKRNKPDERILARNMESNGWDRIIVNTNSWKICQPFQKDDVLLDYSPPKKQAKGAQR